MKKVIIHDNQVGLLYQNGSFVRLLRSGKYRTFGGNEIEVLPFDPQTEITPRNCPLEMLLSQPDIVKMISGIEVGDQQIAFHFVNGKFAQVLRQGRHGFWSLYGQHSFECIDISKPDVDPSVPEYLFSMIPDTFFTRIEVAPYQKARLFFNGQFERILEPGVYYFWKNGTDVTADYIDTRLLQMSINGQEILTLDKISIRISFVFSYRITDYVKILTEIDDYESQLHTEVQLALREYTGSRRLDDILENRSRISEFVIQRLKEKEAAFYISVESGGVKDIIFPGEIRSIMNTVLIAEKQAQANVIARREEVASTRSLLNTAKLMDENKTLCRLKELEYAEHIFQNLQSLSLNGSGDILTQLTSLLHRS